MRRTPFGLVAVSTFALAAGSASAADLTIWWNKSYYPEEDQQFDKIVKEYEEARGLDVEYAFYTNEDAPKKVLAALTAGQPPDLAYGFVFDLQYTSRWAFDDQLEDVSEVVEPLKQHLRPNAYEAVQLLNGRTNERAIYAIPVAQQVEHIHVWKSMTDQAELDLAELPKTWDEWWGWWCDEAQPAVRSATGSRQIYGIGNPMSSTGTDTTFSFFMFMNAFDVKVVDENGAVIIDQYRDGLVQALESYTKPFGDRCVPPGSVNWGDADNNVNFLNKILIMVPNPSLSIPASQYAKQDVYLNELVTTEWPDKPDGRPIEYYASVKTAVVFKNSRNKQGAKDFMKFFLEPDHLGPYLEGSLARWFPADTRIIDRPFWKEQNDPHRVVEVRQYMERPQVPFPQVYNHKVINLNAENAWGKAVTRIVLEDWDAEEAADELIARVKTVAG